MNEYVGKRIRILRMDGEPQYGEREGMVKHVDDMGHLHGTWGGLAVIPSKDMFEVIQED